MSHKQKHRLTGKCDGYLRTGHHDNASRSLLPLAGLQCAMPREDFVGICSGSDCKSHTATSLV